MTTKGRANLSQLRSSLAHPLAQPLGTLLARTGLPPNALTVLGFGANLGAAAVIASGSLFWGGLLVLAAGLCDLLDGALARAAQRTSRFGALLDSTLDRLSEAALLFGLLVYYLRGTPSNYELLLVYLALVSSVLVSYIKARGEGLGLRCEVGFFTRAERVIVLALGLLLRQLFLALLVITFLSFLTAGQRLLHLWRQSRAGSPGNEGGKQ